MPTFRTTLTTARAAALLVTVLLLAMVGTSLPATAVSTEKGGSGMANGGGSGTYVDAGVVGQLADGPAPVVLSWDGDVATRTEVLGHLEGTGVPFHAFSHLDMAVVCATDQRDVDAVATTPGGVSVFGDEELVATLELPSSGPLTAAAAPAGGSLDDLDVTGDGIGIAVFDTGVDGTHPDLAFGPKTVMNTAVLVSHYEILGVGEDTCAPDTYQEDVQDSEVDSGHGTAIAGVAAGDGTASDGQIIGMAPDADVIGVNVTFQVTPEYHGDVKMSLIRFIAAVNHVLSNALIGGPTVAKVALIGWGRTGLYDPFHPHFLAIRDLWDFGIVPVVPVGNGGTGDSDCSDASTCHFNPMGVGNHVIAVGASTDDGSAPADYSSAGDPLIRQARGQWVSYEPIVLAPGTNVAAPFRAGAGQVGTPEGTTTYQVHGAGSGVPVAEARYQAMTGTSVAAARVAGAIALMQERALEVTSCYLPPFMVRQILEGSATPIDGAARHQAGSGVLDVAAAVEWAGDPKRAIYGGPNPWDCRR